MSDKKGFTYLNKQYTKADGFPIYQSSIARRIMGKLEKKSLESNVRRIYAVSVV